MDSVHLTGRRTLPPRRRTLPPVPRRAADALPAGRAAQEAPGPGYAAERGQGRRPREHSDAGQRFVARLRAAAADFATAAGVKTAIVREAVPPARHRRCRCRVVLRQADGSELDLTFLGAAAGQRGQLPADFDERIQEWFQAGQPRRAEWLVVDRDAADGLAIDLTAWPPAG